MYLEGKAAELGLETTLEKKLLSEEVGPGCDEVAHRLPSTCRNCSSGHKTCKEEGTRAKMLK